LCWSCCAKFYDFNRSEPSCPKCNANPGDAPKLVDVATKAALALRAKKELVDELDAHGVDEPIADGMDLFDGFEEEDG
jgi:hypothetical protein